MSDINKSYICVLSNSLYGNYLKITHTKISPIQYAVKLSENKAVPSPLVVVHYKPFYDYLYSMKQIYKKFKKNKISGKNFFSVALKEISNFIDELAVEDFRRELKRKNIYEKDFKNLEKELRREEKKSEYKKSNKLESLKISLDNEKDKISKLEKVISSKNSKIDKLAREVKILQGKDNKEISKLLIKIKDKDKEIRRLTEKLNEFSDNFIVSDLLSESELNRTKKFSSIKQAMGDAKNVYRLYLWNANLEKVSSKISNFKNLQELYLWNNKLATLPSEISNLQNLQKLFLSENKFKTLPEEILNLKKLEKLDLRANDFMFLTGEISRLSKLKILYLSNNRLISIPEEIEDLIDLKELDLRGNPIPSEEKKRIKKLLNKVEIRF